jgi:hypothetical protein
MTMGQTDQQAPRVLDLPIGVGATGTRTGTGPSRGGGEHVEEAGGQGPQGL